MKYDEQNVEAKFSQSITTDVQDLHRGLRRFKERGKMERHDMTVLRRTRKDLGPDLQIPYDLS